MATSTVPFVSFACGRPTPRNRIFGIAMGSARTCPGQVYLTTSSIVVSPSKMPRKPVFTQRQPCPARSPFAATPPWARRSLIKIRTASLMMSSSKMPSGPCSRCRCTSSSRGHNEDLVAQIVRRKIQQGQLILRWLERRPAILANGPHQPLRQHGHQGGRKSKRLTAHVNQAVIAPVASLVCSVLQNRWPVSDA